jgi:hypothetical protein
MTRRRKLLITGAGVLALAAGGAGIAQAVGGDSDEQASGSEAERAKRAAVEFAGGGRAIGVERENEGRSAWEVEVHKDDGSEVEIDLSSDLKRVAAESDDDDGQESGQDDEGRGDQSGEDAD